MDLARHAAVTRLIMEHLADEADSKGGQLTSAELREMAAEAGKWESVTFGDD